MQYATPTSFLITELNFCLIWKINIVLYIPQFSGSLEEKRTSSMDVMQSSDPSHHGIVENSPYRISYDRHAGGQLDNSWYFSRKEIEENSLSRRDGIDLKKESYLRKSYCTFLQDLGMRLKV
jgi:hypothetical protein